MNEQVKRYWIDGECLMTEKRRKRHIAWVPASVYDRDIKVLERRCASLTFQMNHHAAWREIWKDIIRSWWRHRKDDRKQIAEQAETIKALEAENARLRIDAAELFLEEAHVEGSTFEARMHSKVGRAIGLFIRETIAASGGENFVTTKLDFGGDDPCYMTFGRSFGKTPDEKYQEKCEQLDAQAETITRLRGALETIDEDYGGTDPELRTRIYAALKERSDAT